MVFQKTNGNGWDDQENEKKLSNGPQITPPTQEAFTILHPGEKPPMQEVRPPRQRCPTGPKRGKVPIGGIWTSAQKMRDSGATLSQDHYNFHTC